MPSDPLEMLASEIENLAPADQLRLAASLLEARSAELALAVMRKVERELGLALTLRARSDRMKT